MIREYLPVLLQIIVAIGFAVSALLVSALSRDDDDVVGSAVLGQVARLLGEVGVDAAARVAVDPERRQIADPHRAFGPCGL